MTDDTKTEIVPATPNAAVTSASGALPAARKRCTAMTTPA